MRKSSLSYWNTANTAAAIAAGVYENNRRYMAAYHRLKEAIGGFPGFYTLIADFAVVVEKIGYDDEVWLGICDRVGRFILDLESAEDLTESKVTDYVRSIIRKHQTETAKENVLVSTDKPSAMGAPAPTKGKAGTRAKTAAPQPGQVLRKVAQTDAPPKRPQRVGQKDLRKTLRKSS